MTTEATTTATTTDQTAAQTQAQTPAAEFKVATTETTTAAATPAATPVQEEVVYDYQPTGNAGLDVALNYIGGLGFGADNPAVVAATKGDFTALESSLKALGAKAKGYERYVALAKDAYQGIVAKRTDAQAKSVATVHEAVGGKETWDKVAAFVSQHADDKERAEIDAAFTAGGTTAKAMARHLHSLYQNASGAVKTVVKEEAAAAAPSSSNAPLAPKEFVAEVRKLQQRVGGTFESHPDYAALRRRANAYGR